jgi:hypothetical protein
MHYMVCISGFAGAGKDECASRLVHNHRAVQTGLADPGKRHMADSYGFTEQQLFGPSPFRNAGDVRIPKNAFYGDLENGRSELLELPGQMFPTDIKAGTEAKYKIDPNKKYWVYVSNAFDDSRPWRQNGDGSWTIFVQEADPEFWLSPREALQQYLEKMNQLDVYTWIRKGVADQIKLAAGKHMYSRMYGLVPLDQAYMKLIQEEPGARSPGIIPEGQNAITCFADFRHIPEIQYVRDFVTRGEMLFTPILIRVKRPSVKTPPYNHRSENEQTKIRDAAFDAIVHNDKDLPHLYAQIDDVIRAAMAGSIRPKPWSPDYVIADRRPEEGYAP